MNRYRLTTIAILTTLVLFTAAGTRAGDKKGTPWKGFLPDDAYKELTRRSLERIAAIAKSGDKDAPEKIEAEGAILVGYTLSTKDASRDDVARLRGAALRIAGVARKNELAQLADFPKTIATAPKSPADISIGKNQLQQLTWMMETFRGKSKGGEGLHADLQYHPKLKNLNGTEAFIGAIAGKKLSEENVAKVAKELPHFGYRMAVLGSITHEFAPAKENAQWRALSLQMRDAGVALADAANKKNADGIFSAAQALENTCTKCHMVFRKAS